MGVKTDAAVLRLARIHHPVTVLGPGRRIGMWVQGCSIGCAGCMSKDTWAFDSGHEVLVEEVVRSLVDIRDDAAADGLPLTGVTISGGEPFDQPLGLQRLASQLRAAWPDVDLLAYSGYRWERLVRDHAPVLGVLDAVMSEPFVRSRPTALPWRGSANQRLHLLTPLGRSRFEHAEREGSASSDAPRLQVAVNESGVHLIGIPDRDLLDGLDEALRANGLELEDPSWR